MDSFDSKWGHVPNELSQKNNFYIIVVTQFVLCFAILMTLQPPFISLANNDDYSQSKPSIYLILIVCLACVFTSALMNNNINNLWNSFKKH